ncbi:MAG: hypothetical protein Q8N96_00555 [Methylovulum sp.]|nr:hypothetical protein [Methylovulum sp.]
MPDDLCRLNVKYASFNPFKRDRQQLPEIDNIQSRNNQSHGVTPVYSPPPAPPEHQPMIVNSIAEDRATFYK